MNKIKVMWVTDCPFSATGYGSVGRNILNRLQKDGRFEVHAVTTNYAEQKLEGFTYGGEKFDFPVYPRINDDHGADALWHFGLQIKPDVIITLRDVGLQMGYIPYIDRLKAEYQKDNKKLTWIQYDPIDTHYLPQDWQPILGRADVVLAMSEHGVKMIKQFFNMDVPFIPHGVDLNKFKRLPDEERLRLRKARNLDTMFVAGACGRNQLRKMWNMAVRGFAAFSKDKMDTRFLFHSDINATFVSDGWSFQSMGVKYGILDPKTGVSKLEPTFPDMSVLRRRDIDDKELCKFYNMLDVYYFLTGGEGFGIPTLEALACGCPLIVTDNTTGPELGKDHCILIPALKDKYGDDIVWEGQNGVTFTIPDWREGGKALEKFYSDEAYRKECSLKAEAHAKKYDYDIVAKQWMELILKHASQ